MALETSTTEPSLMIKGPEYHENLVKLGGIKMRKVDLIRRQSYEK